MAKQVEPRRIKPEEGIFERPRHPYTQALLSAVPNPDPGARALRAQGRHPEPLEPAFRMPLPDTLPTAILDRLLHHSRVLNIAGRSYRLRDLEQAVRLPK